MQQRSIEDFDGHLLFADGSSLGNPGPGGYGTVVVLNKKHVVELGGFDTDMTEPDRFASTVVPADSPYATVAVVQDEALRRARRLPPTDAARCIADVVEHPSPPVRTVYPAELAALIARESQISDDDYMADSIPMAPRFGASTNSVPLPLLASFGRRITTSAENSTVAFRFRRTNPISVIRLFCGRAGSTAK